MAFRKNQIIQLNIEGLSSDGNGVGHADGEAVFVPSTAPGDVLQVRIVKDCKRYAFGITEEVVSPSPMRIPLDCTAAKPCGGCCYRHLSYEAECTAKQQVVADAFERLGGFSLAVEDILPSPEVDRYRNKAQFPVGTSESGEIITGFYASRSHRVVPCRDCKLQPSVLNQIANYLCALFTAHKITAYNETSHTGLVRHIFLRRGAHSGEIMVCLVCNGNQLPYQDEITQSLTTRFPQITSIVLNENTQQTNLILGKHNIVLWGNGYIEDTLAGVPVQLGPLSFYQVNTLAAEQLYAVAAEFANLQQSDTLLDLYCGMGTIGLSMVDKCARLIGVEIVPEAIESAKQNASQMDVLRGTQNDTMADVCAKTRFLCADAGTASQQLVQEGLRPDVIIVDPPRKGCDTNTLEALCTMAPSRIVMVSCNPATAARDAKYLAEHGYELKKVRPADFFPRTRHVECVCLLTQNNV